MGMDARSPENHELVVRRVQPLGSHIAIAFLEPTSGGQFVNKTEWGFDYQVSTMNTTQPGRWAKVLGIGELVVEADVPVGSYVFIEPLMWSTGFAIDGMQFWLTGYEKIMLVSKTEPEL
jgi:hypothetical protein